MLDGDHSSFWHGPNDNWEVSTVRVKNVLPSCSVERLTVCGKDFFSDVNVCLSDGFEKVLFDKSL
jgi:hypothetical protein